MPAVAEKKPRGSAYRRDKKAARTRARCIVKYSRHAGICEGCQWVPSQSEKLTACVQCKRRLCAHCLQVRDRTACWQCPEVDRVLASEPANCQICGWQCNNMQQLLRCPDCKLFGCSWCQLTDRDRCRVCPANPHTRWPRPAPTQGPSTTLASWVVDVCKGRLQDGE